MAQRQALYTTLNALAQEIEIERLEDWQEQLLTWAGQAPGAALNRSLNWDELQVLAASPWTTIGAHTVSHAALSALDEEQQRQEIFASKETLEKQHRHEDRRVLLSFRQQEALQSHLDRPLS